MKEMANLTVAVILSRLLIAAVIGGIVGYERRLRHKAIGIAGMVLVATGSTTYMMLSWHLASVDPGALGRAVQGILQGIGFLGGAVIFKSGADVHGIKTAAAIWIMGAVGLAIGTDLWVMGAIVGVATAIILLVADWIPSPPGHVEQAVNAADRAYGKAEK